MDELDGQSDASGIVQPFQLQQFAGCIAWGSSYEDAAKHSGIRGELVELASLARRTDMQGYIAIAIRERLGGDVNAINAIVAARLWDIHVSAMEAGDASGAIKALEAWNKKQAINLSNEANDAGRVMDKASMRDLWGELRRRSKATGDTATEAIALRAMDGVDGVSVESAAQANLRALAGIAGKSAVTLNFQIAGQEAMGVGVAIELAGAVASDAAIEGDFTEVSADADGHE